LAGGIAREFCFSQLTVDRVAGFFSSPLFPWLRETRGGREIGMGSAEEEFIAFGLIP
jgi:hypothetical protein